MTANTLDRPVQGNLTQSDSNRTERPYHPNVDILETPEEITVLADVPGASAESVDILFENGTLSIHGKVTPREPVEARLLLREYGVGDFHRSFQIGEVIDTANIAAECANGVLTLHLPKVEKAMPRKIQVKSS